MCVLRSWLLLIFVYQQFWNIFYIFSLVSWKIVWFFYWVVSRCFFSAWESWVIAGKTYESTIGNILFHIFYRDAIKIYYVKFIRKVIRLEKKFLSFSLCLKISFQKNQTLPAFYISREYSTSLVLNFLYFFYEFIRRSVASSSILMRRHSPRKRKNVTLFFWLLNLEVYFVQIEFSFCYFKMPLKNNRKGVH